MCLEKKFECDGENDCDDGKDESPGKCNVKQCKEFQCMNGGCVDANKKCDGKEDCIDGTDEMFCGEQDCLRHSVTPSKRLLPQICEYLIEKQQSK